MRGRIIAIVAGALVFGAVATRATAQDQQALVARGQYLVNGPAACGNCHTPKNADKSPRTDMFLAGGEKFESPVFTAYSRNLTPDKETGIGTWTDDQVIRAIREGVTKEGETLGPPMPIRTYHNMSDTDVRSIVAYLRTVKPIHNEVPESKYKIPLKPQEPVKSTAAPDKGDKVAYGGYIVTAIAHCFECHTTPGERGPDFANHLGAGGAPFTIKPGFVIKSRNITPDVETGLGSWTDEQIKRAITEGIDKDGKPLFRLMSFANFKAMTPDDLDAVVAFLRSIPAVSNKVEPNPPMPN